MRLEIVDRPVRLLDRIKARLIALVSGGRTPDVTLTLLHRSQWFGQPFVDTLSRVMRGPSEWSVGERELMAAFVSKQNECRY